MEMIRFWLQTEFGVEMMCHKSRVFEGPATLTEDDSKFQGWEEK